MFYLLPIALLIFANADATIVTAPSKVTTAPLHQAPPAHTSLSIGGHVLDVELATDEPSREKGLMDCTSLELNQGMLFVFPRAKQVHFWMKGTALPLSAAYINSSGRIIEIHDLKPFNEQLIPSSSSNIAYVLEVRRGWFLENQVLAGDIVTGLPSPSSAR
ncbi:MAG: DUF192 domain-containing protein [Chthoniobacterales bacterium]